ncbi:hypothetical protein PRIPAC_88267 [Pristionchus pacificus]|uniref:Uncharacterized protein n=1 Tax=Pristionchus pacificus TaxID=54126 RepID=A0A2A6B5U3_PRIPA|nr:hypothetical protein PRIPAC_88267 [Pristionchus pacificus]|eukprot:PDM61242.1 hypothetical protein PRIPAC_50684 [Pristionchus pacificus]
MPATRFSTPLAVLDLAPPTSPSTGTTSSGSSSSPSSRPASSAASALGQTTPAMRRSTETIDSRRSSSSSSAMASPRGSLTYSPTAAPSRFAVSGIVQGATKLETGLVGVHALLEKTRAAHINAVHVQTSDPVLADIVGNMSEHLRTEFATFAWPRLLTDRVQWILRKISVETIMVDVTIEYVPEKEGLFRRFSHQIKSVFNFIRSFR